MAGHSKWSNIKHRKGAQDVKRGKAFTKLIKEITISSRLGGGDLDSNPRLRKAVNNAKSTNLPADKIERAIKKGTGELEGVIYDEITYEGFGPGGVALILDVITDNKNRSVAEIRHLLSKYGGNLGETGSVAWMFDAKGIIVLNSNCGNKDILFEAAIEYGAEDFIDEDSIYNILTNPLQLLDIRDSIEKDGYHIQSAEIEMVPKIFQKLNFDDSESAFKLLDALEDNDDINNLYTNFEMENLDSNKD